MSSRLMLHAAGGMLWTAVCLWMALAAPRRAQGDDLAPPATLAAADTSVAAGSPVFVGDATCPRYWIVSSRNAPQGYNDDCGGGLEFFERRPDGALCRTSAAGMTSQFLPGVPVCVFVHGSFVSWEDHRVESHQTYLWIRRACPDRPLHVVFFTWPSDRITTLLVGCEVLYRGRQAEYNAFHVACLLARIPDGHPVCLVGHSYGARIALAAIHLGAGGSLEGYKFPGHVGCKRLRAVLAAAALDHHWLNDCQRYDRALCRAECVLNLRNKHDLALKTYNVLRPCARRALGSSGVTWLDRRAQTCTATIRDLDVSWLIGCGHYWPNYFECQQLAGMIASWVYFPESNPGYGWSAKAPAMNPAAPGMSPEPSATPPVGEPQDYAPPLPPESTSKPELLPGDATRVLLPPPAQVVR
jgi:hypothetical protein